MERLPVKNNSHCTFSKYHIYLWEKKMSNLLRNRKGVGIEVKGKIRRKVSWKKRGKKDMNLPDLLVSNSLGTNLLKP